MTVRGSWAFVLISVASAWLVPLGATQPSIAVSVDSGPPGTAVTITGTGFPPGEIVALYIDAAGPYIGQPGPRADAQGGFRKDFIWPGKGYDTTGRVDPSSPGPHNVCGDTAYPSSSQSVAAKACAVFQVTAPSSPTPAAATKLQQGQVSAVLFAFGIILAAFAVGGLLWVWRSK
jgi:hypothetical protein